MTSPDFVVVGSGPNGLVAAIELLRAGHSVTVIEGRDTPGGGMRSADLTATDSIHDICATAFPMAMTSPAMADIPLADLGVRWLTPTAAAAHPLDGGRAAMTYQSIERTAAGLDGDATAYRRLLTPLVDQDVVDGALNLLSVPRNPVKMARMGVAGLPPATLTARRFRTEEARALFAGMAAHSMMKLTTPLTSAYWLTLNIFAHLTGWPIVEGGAGRLAEALATHVIDLGGTIEVGRWVRNLDESPARYATVFDTSASALADICGDRLPDRAVKQLRALRRGPGVFKVDWLLDGPIPWTNPDVATAATVHVGGTLDEIAASEADANDGRHSEAPFVLLVQPNAFDPSRSAPGTHTVWAYCHVPNGSTVDMTEAMTRQVERFAPGFRDRILATSAMDTQDFEAYNPNYLGGDINGGLADLVGLFRRPRWAVKPWRMPTPGVYLCSSSTPPGGGVHGMCGRHAASVALADLRDGRLG